MVEEKKLDVLQFWIYVCVNFRNFTHKLYVAGQGGLMKTYKDVQSFLCLIMYKWRILEPEFITVYIYQIVVLGI
jgi:hypothetical protein